MADQASGNHVVESNLTAAFDVIHDRFKVDAYELAEREKAGPWTCDEIFISQFHSGAVCPARGPFTG